MLSASSPCSFILFGASGHLAQIKIYPALYILMLKERLPDDFCMIGFSRTEMDDSAFRTLISDAIRKDVPEINEKILQHLLGRCFYQAGQYTEEKDYAELAKKLTQCEKGWKSVTRVAYFSVPPSLFTSLSENLCKGGVHSKKTPLRCIVEKPVGNDLASFEEICSQLTNCFNESDIFLLDHYLGKEAVRNVYYLRFANPILERLFKNTLIDHVEISALEPGGLEGRAGYFEHTGTFRDMFQSHLLMISALLTMRLRDNDESIPESRLDALKQFYIPPAKTLDDVVLQGQYVSGVVKGEPVPGYLEEKEIGKGSRTNTFAVLKLMSRTSRWAGVPFFLRSGKRLEKKETRISIAFQEPHAVGKSSSPNRLDIILQGEAGMKIFLQTKIGGTEPEYRPLILEDPLVCMGDCLPEHGILLLEAINGTTQWFMSFEETRFAWRLLDPIQSHLDDKSTPLFSYKAGSRGPKEADQWIERDGHHWF